MKKLLYIFALFVLMSTVGCMREPELHLYEPQTVEINIPLVRISLKVFWDYKWDVDVNVEYSYHICSKLSFTNFFISFPSGVFLHSSKRN